MPIENVSLAGMEGDVNVDDDAPGSDESLQMDDNLDAPELEEIYEGSSFVQM